MAYKNPKARPKHKQRATTTKTKRASSQKGEHVTDPNNLSHQEKVDAILDKIKQSGYESLSKEEKEFLFNASKK